MYQGTAGIYATANHHVNDWFRIQPGLRADAFHFDVDSDNPANSGDETDTIVSPKLSLIFGPWADTERFGVEWSSYWRPNGWLMVDNEITHSEGRLLDVGGDDEIPGAVPLTLDTGITIGRDEGFFGSLRSRYFSPRPLVEDGSVDSRQSWQVNGRIGYRKNDWEVAVDCLNILGRDDNDIEYFYASRLPGEPAAGVEDIHLHPAEPRTFRISLTRRF